MRSSVLALLLVTLAAPIVPSASASSLQFAPPITWRCATETKNKDGTVFGPYDIYTDAVTKQEAEANVRRSLKADGIEVVSVNCKKF